MLTLLSWNINGIRSFKCSVQETLASLNADIVCFQETKITRDMLDEPTALVNGYNSYYSFSKKRAGYSGVATYCKERSTPVAAEEGVSGLLNPNMTIDSIGRIKEEFRDSELKDLDAEGRCVITEHFVKDENGVVSNLVVINVYCPRADAENEERVSFKLRFYRVMELRCQAFIKSGKHVVVLGDINTSHRRIDTCKPDDDFENSPSRIWLSQFLITEEHPGGLMIDSFRHLYPTKERVYTCWNTLLSARANNYGTRIDYIFISPSLLPFLIDSACLPDIQGSDHCPVQASFRLTSVSSSKCPAFCTKFYKEFAGKQATIASFLTKHSATKNNSLTAIAEEGSRPIKKPRLETKKIYSYFQKTQSNSGVNSDAFSSSFMEAKVSRTDSESLDICSENEISSTAMVANCQAVQAWKSLLKGPSAPPLCKGHSEPCVLRTVKKKGVNMNRQFWVCRRGEGHKNDPEAKCDFFQWLQKR